MKKSLAGPRIAYLCIILFAVIFTQALRSNLSAFLFWFVLLLPVITFLYALISRAFVYCGVRSQSSEASQSAFEPLKMIRGGTAKVVCYLENNSFLPIFYVEAHIVHPDKSTVNVIRGVREMTLLPFGYAETSEEITFPYRGKYTVGFEYIEIYDLLRLFRLRVKTKKYAEIEVYPENGSLDVFGDGLRSVSGEAFGLSRSNADRTELFGIRSYTPGDSLKDIHWKLSGKNAAEEFDPLSKIYSNDDTRIKHIVCDLSYQASDGDTESVPSPEIRALSDAVIEAALALAFSAMKRAMPCRLTWFDSSVGSAVSKNVSSYGEFVSAYASAAFAMPYREAAGPAPEKLLGDSIRFSETCDIYPVTSSLTGGTVRAFRACSAAGARVHPVLIAKGQDASETERSLLIKSGLDFQILPQDRPFFVKEDFGIIQDKRKKR